MASEQAFWKNFAEGVGRVELFERWPGSKYADHARGNLELQAELKEIFRTKSTEDWLAFGLEHDVPIAPVHDSKSVATDPQFQHRMPLYRVDEVGAEQLPLPLKVVDEELPWPTRAPEVGEHTDEVLADVLGYDETDRRAPRGWGAGRSES